MRAPPTSRASAYGFTQAKREGDDIEAINKLFAPEFRNRLDAIISFGHLPKEVVAKVVDKFVLQLEAQLADRNVTIELSDEAREWLVEHGYDEAMGARPMARLIQSTIKTPLADEVLFGRLKDGGAVRVVRARAEDAGKDGARLRVPGRSGDAEAREGRGQRRQEAQAREGQGRRRARRTTSATTRAAQRRSAASARCRRCRWSRPEALDRHGRNGLSARQGPVLRPTARGERAGGRRGVAGWLASAGMERGHARDWPDTPPQR